jgi:hypothetical protein
VALSRATCLEGLFLTSFNASLIKAHPEVRAYYNSLGYLQETDHADAVTVTSSLTELCDLFRNPSPPVSESAASSSSSSSSGVQGDPSLVVGGGDDGRWISKRAETVITGGSGMDTTRQAMGGTGVFSSYAYDDFMEVRAMVPDLSKIHPPSGAAFSTPFTPGESPETGGNVRGGGDGTPLPTPRGEDLCSGGSGSGSGGGLIGQKRSFTSAAALSESLSQSLSQPQSQQSPIVYTGVKGQNAQPSNVAFTSSSAANALVDAKPMFMKDFFPSKKSEHRSESSGNVALQDRATSQRQWTSVAVTNARMKSSDPSVTVDLTCDDDGGSGYLSTYPVPDRSRQQSAQQSQTQQQVQSSRNKFQYSQNKAVYNQQQQSQQHGANKQLYKPPYSGHPSALSATATTTASGSSIYGRVMPFSSGGAGSSVNTSTREALTASQIR